MSNDGGRHYYYIKVNKSPLFKKESLMHKKRGMKKRQKLIENVIDGIVLSIFLDDPFVFLAMLIIDDKQ